MVIFTHTKKGPLKLSKKKTAFQVSCWKCHGFFVAVSRFHLCIPVQEMPHSTNYLCDERIGATWWICIQGFQETRGFHALKEKECFAIPLSTRGRISHLFLKAPLIRQVMSDDG